MNEQEARKCANLFARRWPDKSQLRLTIEQPTQENAGIYVLRLYLPQHKRLMRMVHKRQLGAAMDKLAQVLGKGVSRPSQQNPGVRRGRPPKANTQVQPSQLVPSGPVRWKYGDLCEIHDLRDGPFTVLAVVDHDTLLCKRLNGSLFHASAKLARLIARG